jgi:elongator complex protein 1
MPLPLEESSPNALQVALTQAGDVCVLMADAKMYYLQPNGEQTTTINLSERCIGIFAIGAGIVFQSGSGALTFAEKGKPSSRIAQFSEPCLHFSIAEVEEQLICYGLSAKGKLYANDRLLTSGVTSMLVLGSLIAYTTTTQLHFIHIAAQPDLLQIPVAGSSDERSRQIDRGSLLICACLSAESVTLQAPRGNLETVYPRLLVLAGIRKAIDNGQWRHAWQKAKLHRIDTNILCDYDFPKFMSHMADFVDALESSTELDIFLSGLKAENVSTSMYLSTFPDNVGVPAPA